MALILSCQVVSKSHGARLLFESISMGISDGERVGLIGPNGAGKSTFLKLLLGHEAPDSGTIHSGSWLVSVMCRRIRFLFQRNRGVGSA